MFDIGLQEMLLIGVLALLVFGPSKLPELGRMVGRAMREFRRASEEFRSTVETNLHLNEPDPLPTETSTSSEPSSSTPWSSAGGAVETPITSENASSEEMVPTDEPSEPFCAKRGSPIFHRSTCGWVARIPVVDRVYVKHVADARDQGLVTCPVCEPWEPS